MKAGYLVGKWIINKVQQQGKSYVVAALAASVGRSTSQFIVNKAMTAGATAAATAIAAKIGAGSSVAGPIATIVGAASGWL